MQNVLREVLIFFCFFTFAFLKYMQGSYSPSVKKQDKKLKQQDIEFQKKIKHIKFGEVILNGSYHTNQN